MELYAGDETHFVLKNVLVWSSVPTVSCPQFAATAAEKELGPKVLYLNTPVLQRLPRREERGDIDHKLAYLAFDF